MKEKEEERTPVDAVFSALADPTRRGIVEQLHTGDSTLLELSSSFSMSFQAISKHIRILEKASIVQKRKQGKYRILSLQQESMGEAIRWMSYYSKFWNESFDKLEEVIRATKNKDGEV